MSQRIAVTGATGFVGRPLVRELELRGRTVRQLVRRQESVQVPLSTHPGGLDICRVGEIGPTTDWSLALEEVDTVIHCAARVHVLNESEAQRRQGCERVNRDGTLHLAEAAAGAGVRRLVFLSSIKVNGEQTAPGRPFTATSVPAPADAYGASKWEAEQGLQAIAARTGLEVVVIRPPLVHGPRVRANMLRLLRLMDRGLPLPFASIRNRRSALSLANLIDLVVLCVDHPAAAGATFLAADDWSPSTPELVRFLAEALQRPARLFPVPTWLLTGLGAILGRSEEIRRLTGSLQVDAGFTLQRLGWTPPLEAKEGLRRTVSWYRSLLD